MIRVFAPLAVLVLASCGGSSSTATFSCANGPDLAVNYADDAARVAFSNGRVEVLQRIDPERPNFYAKSGVTWDAAVFRTSRLTDGAKSFQCDQLS